MASGPSRRRFLGALAAGAGALSRRAAAVGTGAWLRSGPGLTHGPMLGHLTPHTVRVWARATSPGAYTLVAYRKGARISATARADPDRDLTLVWELSGLEPGTRYTYAIHRGDEVAFVRPDATITTPPPQSAPALVRLAVGSCAWEEEGDRTVWRRMAVLDPHAVVLLGDTPYIDSTDLEVQRRRRREFASVTEYAELLRTRPLYATWDDHDFGANDSDGRLAGKEDARRAFVEYHANPSYGDGREGVYTKFRLGGVELFLLDTRYFAGTGPSPIAEGPTMLGPAQWAWLSEGLRASDAPFKVLASGLVWNGAVRPGKPDHWESYSGERDALFRFLGSERISGVVLLAGDVHRTRVLRYGTTDRVGYDLTELVTSPIHSGVIAEANAPHPALVHDSGEPHAFLLLTVDTTGPEPRLHASFENASGRVLHALTLRAGELSSSRSRS